MLIGVILHAEFISAMKTVQNPTIFMKNAVNFLRFSLKKNQKKSENNWKRRQIAKFEIFKFLTKSFIYAYDKIGGNYALSANSLLIRIILHAEFIS